MGVLVDALERNAAIKCDPWARGEGRPEFDSPILLPYLSNILVICAVGIIDPRGDIP
jgi:hypothetical protein